MEQYYLRSRAVHTWPSLSSVDVEVRLLFF